MSNRIAHLFAWQKARDTKDRTFIPHESLISINNTYKLINHVMQAVPPLGTLLKLSTDQHESFPTSPKFVRSDNGDKSGTYLWCELALVDEKELND